MVDWFVSIVKPCGMDFEEAIRRSGELVPCDTGQFQLVDEGPEAIYGNLECEDGFRAAKGESYGPDDAGVQISF